MKVIMLDIDGVMNSAASCELADEMRSRGEFLVCRPCTGSLGVGLCSVFNLFAPWSVAALNQITDTTGAKIVISSTWRRDAIPWLRIWGVRGDIIDTTPVLDRYNGTIYLATTRGDEIASWFERWPSRPGAQTVTQFVILDDDADMGALLPRLVQTDARGRGLTHEHAERAIEML